MLESRGMKRHRNAKVGFTEDVAQFRSNLAEAGAPKNKEEPRQLKRAEKYFALANTCLTLLNFII